MSASTAVCSSSDLTKSNIHLTGDKERKTWREITKGALRRFKYIFKETTVEPCLFIYMLCTALSSLAVQNMHLEKSCRVNLKFGDDICDRIRDRNTTGLDKELNQVQSLVAQVVAWKFPLQTSIPAVTVLFVGAWSDKTKKRKICILVPFLGEIIANIGLLFATYYFYELSLAETALIEALPAAFSGSYIIIFMGMYSFMADRTTEESRTFRLGLVTICVSLGTPTGTALSGVVLRVFGYYGVFTLLICLYTITFLYGIVRLEDVLPVEENRTTVPQDSENKIKKVLHDVFALVANTILVAIKPRAFGLRNQILSVLILYILMVGPLYGDSQVSYLYAIRKFNFTEVEFSIYGTINIVLGLIGTFFLITILCKKLHVQDSVIGGIAGSSRIFGSLVFALAPTRPWFYSAPLFNIFSHTGLTAVRSIATKSVPLEEVAKLSSVMGVVEALAPSIYMPTSSYIYVHTIDTFPGAFYLFDAALTVVALVLFLNIYFLVRKRDRNMVTDPQRKEDFARTNEVSEF
uniref:MFS transporter 1 n=1 Tax=Limenitis arthemis astyanax TaxID=324813 RepID=A0A6B9UQ65_LIMAT|nr:MFS transporter 1 [Limenitis arthemis astyanax]